MKFLGELEAGNQSRYFSAYPPVMATWSDDSPFPVNMMVKGFACRARRGAGISIDL